MPDGQSTLTRRKLLAGGAGSAIALLAGCTSTSPFGGQRRSDEFTLSRDGVDRLSVSVSVGSITVTGEDRDDIDVSVVKRSRSVRTNFDDLSIERSIQDGLLEIWTEFDGDAGWFERQPSVDLDIAVPEAVGVEHVESEVGEVTIRDVSGNVRVAATSGAVTIESIDGSVDARSTTGRIVISDVTGVVTARATTGRVAVQDVGSIGDIRTSTGRIEAEIPAIDGDTRLSAGTGRIEAAIGAAVDADVYAQSSTGSVSYEGLALTDVSDSSNSVRGRLGDGGPTLEFETDTGRITLGPLE